MYVLFKYSDSGNIPVSPHPITTMNDLKPSAMSSWRAARFQQAYPGEPPGIQQAYPRQPIPFYFGLEWHLL